jgi:lipid II:glycine glycyltransferase (peptidoglycan interpeptide bridge formation enzyme)
LISYTTSGLKIAELYFNESAPAPGAVDVVRYQFRTEPMQGTCTYRFHSIFIELEQDPDQLLARMSRRTREVIRQALKNPDATFRFRPTPAPEVVEEFSQFYHEFARERALPRLSRVRLDAMQRAGALTLSSMIAPDGAMLVWHAYVRTTEWSRLLYSASLFRSVDKDRAKLLSRANRCLHWMDMMEFRERGSKIYDFGGWYGGREDAVKLGINRFKEGFGGRVVELFSTDQARTLKGMLAVQARHVVARLRRDAHVWRQSPDSDSPVSARQ